MKIAFWILVAIDAAFLAVWFVLGLAAATSTRDSSLSVAAYILVVPTLLLALAVFLFLRGGSPVFRGAGFLLAAAPILVLFASRQIATANFKLNSDDNGKLTYFRAGDNRELASAIDSNDVAKVKELLPTVDVNKRGFMDMTPLMYALRQMKATPDRFEVLEALLAAKANPNDKSQQWPLEIAIQQSSATGHAPVLMLLKAGANPNAKTTFGTPVFFAGTYRGVDPVVMTDLIEHGADVKATDNGGRTIVFDAATSNNWPAVLTLLQHGVDYRSGKSINGESFPDMVASHARVYGDTAGVKEVLEYLKTH
jgi:ankyrin repeat protein